MLSSSRRKAGPNVSSSNGSVAKRLQSELLSLTVSGLSDISAFPVNDNLLKWLCTVNGVAGTAYEGLSFKLTIDFPSTYPLKAPLVRFDTACFHPNVDQQGFICLDILKENWSAIYNVQTVLLSIQSLLGEPNNDSPLNPLAASLWDNQVEYRKNVLSKYEEGKKQCGK